MFVRVTADPATRPNTLGVLGMESSSNPIVNLSEFNYKKGTEIYGEKEPAEYVYQVKLALCEATSCFRTAVARSARFTLPATSSGWKTEANTGLRRRRS